MDYQQLHQRYGSRIARRVKTELHEVEFTRVEIAELVRFLEDRAHEAQKEYLTRLDDPLSKFAHTGDEEGITELLHRRWRDAEELAYLVSVTDALGDRRAVG